MLQSSRRLVLALLATSAIVPLLPAAARAQTPITPVNESPRDPALAKVIAACLAAAKARDFKRLSPHVGERIALDFGGGRGRAEFGRRLARVPAAWDELVWVLENGGRFQEDRSYWAPYTFSVDVGNIDAFEAAIVVERTKAHADPRADAPVLAEIERSLIKVTDWKRTDQTPMPFFRRQDWVQVELQDKRKAWVQAKHVRASADFRAGFQKVRGVWKMMTFIAGD